MSAIRNTRHFYEFEEAVLVEDVTYFQRYLNDVGVIVGSATQNSDNASTGTGDSETYFRRYLNDIS